MDERTFIFIPPGKNIENDGSFVEWIQWIKVNGINGINVNGINGIKVNGINGITVEAVIGRLQRESQRKFQFGLYC